MATAWRRQRNDGNGGGIMATAWRQAVFAAWRRRRGGGSLVVAAVQQSEGGGGSDGRRASSLCISTSLPRRAAMKGKLPVHDCRVLCCY